MKNNALRGGFARIVGLHCLQLAAGPRERLLLDRRALPEAGEPMDSARHGGTRRNEPYAQQALEADKSSVCLLFSKENPVCREEQYRGTGNRFTNHVAPSDRFRCNPI